MKNWEKELEGLAPFLLKAAAEAGHSSCIVTKCCLGRTARGAGTSFPSRDRGDLQKR